MERGKGDIDCYQSILQNKPKFQGHGAEQMEKSTFFLHSEIDNHETLNVLRGRVQPVFWTLTPWQQSLGRSMRLINLLLIPGRNFVQCPAL